MLRPDSIAQNTEENEIQILSTQELQLTLVFIAAWFGLF